MIICAYVVRRPTKTIYGVVKGSDFKFCEIEVNKQYPGYPMPEVMEVPFFGAHLAEIHTEYKIPQGD